MATSLFYRVLSADIQSTERIITAVLRQDNGQIGGVSYSTLLHRPHQSNLPTTGEKSRLGIQVQVLTGVPKPSF